MKSANLGSAIVAGALGTLAMTVLMYAAPLMGLPPMDLLGALGSVFPTGVSPYVVGGVMHLGIGVTMALLYALIFERVLPGPRWARGVLFSLLPWLFAITLMGPAMAWLSGTIGQAEARAIANPCAAQPSVRNPCAAVNPCAVVPRPVNPCAVSATPAAAEPASPWLLRTMSLMAHAVFGAVVGMVYRRRESSGA